MTKYRFFKSPSVIPSIFGLARNLRDQFRGFFTADRLSSWTRSIRRVLTGVCSRETRSFGKLQKIALIVLFSVGALFVTNSALALFGFLKKQPQTLQGVWVRSWDVEAFSIVPIEPTTTAVIVYEFLPNGKGRRFEYDYHWIPRYDHFGNKLAKLSTPTIRDVTPITWAADRDEILVELTDYAERLYSYELVSKKEMKVLEDGIFEPLQWSKLDMSFDEALASVKNGNIFPH